MLASLYLTFTCSALLWALKCFYAPFTEFVPRLFFFLKVVNVSNFNKIQTLTFIWISRLPFFFQLEGALERERKARMKCEREKLKLEGELKKNQEDAENLESSKWQLAEQLRK